MKLLTPQDYDAAEQAALVTMPNRIAEISGSAVFDKLGYPTRIRDFRSAVRYVDVMHEGRFQRGVDVLLNGLTDEELELAVEVNHVVGAMTDALYGLRRSASGSLIWAFNMLRHIEALYPDKKLTVLEIGPGSGYLGALLLLKGHRYISTDVTQAFYIWQNHLLTRFDLVSEKAFPLAEDTHADLERRAWHVPWWKYMTMFRDKNLHKVDLVTANHVLTEMPPLGREYTIRLAAKLLLWSDLPLFMFEGWGYTDSSVTPIHEQFVRAGFVARHNDQRLTAYEWLGDGCPQSPIEKQIDAARSRPVSEKAHYSKEVEAALCKAAGVDSLVTPDEQFLRFVGGV